METITIPVDIPADFFATINETKEELKAHFQIKIAIMLFQEGKLTIEKAVQLSGLSRDEFEKMLNKNNILTSQFIMDDIGKLEKYFSSTVTKEDILLRASLSEKNIVNNELTSIEDLEKEAEKW